jgi:hypothetical protein
MKRKVLFTKPRTVVRFTLPNRFIAIPHVLDLVPTDQVAELWYSSDEYRAIKLSLQCAIFQLDDGVLSETESQTSRGLESHTPQQAWMRHLAIKQALRAVMDEQDRQWKRNRDDGDAIGRLYQEQTRLSAEAAWHRGVQDAKLAREICHDLIHRRHMRRKSQRERARGSPACLTEPNRSMATGRPLTSKKASYSVPPTKFLYCIQPRR